MARDNRLDTIKGLLIILVVMGHVITSTGIYNIINHGVMGLIYIFHMPLFILISGYLTKHPDKQSPRDMWKSVGNIFLTIVIFQFLFALRVHYVNGGFMEVMELFPFGVLWYLFSLILWRLILYYTPKQLLNKPLLYFGIALVVSLLSGLTHLGTFLSLQRTMNFYPFFLMGFYYKQGDFNTPLWHNNKVHAAVAVILLPLLFWLFPRCGNIMNGADYYGIAGLPEKVMVYTCSIVVSLLVFNLTRDIKWLRPIGRDSLFYYLYHMFILTLMMIGVVKPYGLPLTFPFVILYTAVTMLILFVMSKIKLFRWLIHPTFKKQEKNTD